MDWIRVRGAGDLRREVEHEPSRGRVAVCALPVVHVPLTMGIREWSGYPAQARLSAMPPPRDVLAVLMAPIQLGLLATFLVCLSPFHPSDSDVDARGAARDPDSSRS